jgi:hypothetical protein
VIYTNIKNAVWKYVLERNFQIKKIVYEKEKTMNRDEAVESMQKSLIWGNWEPQNADAIRTMILEVKRIELLEKENKILRRKLGQPCTICRNHKANEPFLLRDDAGQIYKISQISNCPFCGRFLIENLKNQQ